MTAYDGLDVVCHYHDPVKAPLLREAVLPALAEAASGTVGAHVERHWLHGPHVRVCLRGEPDAVRAAAAAVSGRLRAYLRGHGSRIVTSDAELLHRAAIAGRVELIPPPYTPIWPDNTVAVVTPQPQALERLLGGPAAVQCRTELMRLGVPAVSASLSHLGRRGDAAGARVWLILVAMAAHAGRYPLGLGAGHQSFLSHLEEFLLFHDPEGLLRQSYARHWERHAEAVTDLVARVADGHAESPVEAAWLAWTQAARATAEPAYERGDLPPVPGDAYTDRARQVGDEHTLRQWDPDRRTEYSEFHAQLRQVDFEKVPYARQFVVYRFATNVLYQLLGVCDVEPAERYLAAYLVSQAAERITGVTWRERLDRYLAAQRAQAQPAALSEVAA
ncbi:lantibiotic dehydratase C-terminal domain-containing protein [Catellatospora sp. NPDC049609]|uniref:lantibiotic dehydratase C-terminal domain-containing protein n=1 Tax=Catellatospora sp. NPDC049609 TaxID=3155505 RepID=UPI0034220679